MRTQVLTWLAENVSTHRLRHILGVEQMSIDLACHYHIDEKKAGMAGLMHDLAKSFQPALLLQMARENRIEIDPVCEANPHLLHADVGAVVAKKQFGIEDEEILAAISNHTLGRPHMSLLSCVVFVADALEPNRGSTPELEAMRKLSVNNLYKTVQQASDYSLSYLLSSRRLIHPRAILTRNWALQQASNNQQSKEKSQDLINA